MTFDGRRYSGAGWVYPIAGHPRAYLTGDGVAPALTAAYFSARYRAVMLGQQTYPIRNRYKTTPTWHPPAPGWSSEVAVAEFMQVYLPEHTTHVAAELVMVMTRIAEDVTLYGQVTVTDDSGVDNGTTVSIGADEDNLLTLYGDQAYYRLLPSVELSNTTVPTDTGRVRVRCYGVDGDGNSLPVHPAYAAAWRFTL